MKQEKEIMKKCFIMVLFITYFIVGSFAYRDYGISTDEPTERESTFINIKYVLDTFGVDALDGANGDLENYKDRYYGVIIQVVPAILEWFQGFPGSPTIYYIRHLWTFLICFTGYVCFYLMCREVFRLRWISLLGTAMLALYPRFFAEQFYNIKDMVFAAMVMVSMFATVKLIESKYSVFWTVFFGIVTALTTNVRVVGAIFPILLLGYLWLIEISKKCKIHVEDECNHFLRTNFLIIIIYITSYVVMLPALWKNPLSGIIEVFTEFSNFGWNGTIVFMGKVIGVDELPWYYIPVWLSISLPIWYIILGILILVVVIYVLIKKKQNLHFLSTVFHYKYVLWAVLIGFLPWIAVVVMHSAVYNGWRHFYFVLPPIVFVILSGIDYIFHKFIQNNFIKKGIILISIIGLILQCGWIVMNHPYEMVYLNGVGRIWGSDFDRDYWGVSSVKMSRYILEHDDNEKISLEVSNDILMRFLSEDEKERIELTKNGKYYIETYRGKIGNNVAMEGYDEYYSVTVDGYRIATIFKKKD